jgi:hypothetical protein
VPHFAMVVVFAELDAEGAREAVEECVMFSPGFTAVLEPWEVLPMDEGDYESSALLRQRVPHDEDTTQTVWRAWQKIKHGEGDMPEDEFLSAQETVEAALIEWEEGR